MFDRYVDVVEKLERELMERTEPPSHVDARQFLKLAKIEPLEICIVLSDSIIYKNQGGQVTTAWTYASADGKTRKVLGIERGMPEWPSPYIEEQAA